MRQQAPAATETTSESAAATPRRTVSEQAEMMIGPVGEPRRAYRALVELCCGRCGRPILPGDIFARRSDLGTKSRSRMVPNCRHCLPLRPLADQDQA